LVGVGLAARHVQADLLQRDRGGDDQGAEHRGEARAPEPGGLEVEQFLLALWRRSGELGLSVHVRGGTVSLPPCRLSPARAGRLPFTEPPATRAGWWSPTSHGRRPTSSSPDAAPRSWNRCAGISTWRLPPGRPGSTTPPPCAICLPTAPR